jgi:type IV pilus assembly protein PilW
VKRARGVSLVELMIALFVSALVIAVVVNVFLATGVTARQNDATGRLQQSARLAFQRIERDIRMATFRHCTGFPDDPTGLVAGPTVVNTSDVPADWAGVDTGGAPFALPPDAFVSIHRCVDGTCTPTLPASVGGAAMPAIGTGIGQRARDSDVIIVRYLGGEGIPLTAAMIDERDDVALDQALASAAGWVLADGSRYIVADCQGGDLFRATASASGGLAHDAGNRTRKLSRAYQPSAFTRVYRFPEDMVQRVYYVGYSADPETPDKRVGGLWSNQRGEMLELFAGIDRLQVTALAQSGARFGVIAPAQVASAGAHALRRIDLALLLNGVVEAALKEEPFVFAGATVTSEQLATGSDRRPRRQVTWSMDLRNL